MRNTAAFLSWNRKEYVVYRYPREEASRYPQEPHWHCCDIPSLWSHFLSSHVDSTPLSLLIGLYKLTACALRLAQCNNHGRVNACNVGGAGRLCQVGLLYPMFASGVTVSGAGFKLLAQQIKRKTQAAQKYIMWAVIKIINVSGACPIQPSISCHTSPLGEVSSCVCCIIGLNIYIYIKKKSLLRQL